MKKAKYIDYAYPTSPMAKKLGFAATGCYFIQLTKHANTYMPVGTPNVGFATKAEAAAHAETLPQEWNAFYLKNSSK
jgi:hypothetical protein